MSIDAELPDEYRLGAPGTGLDLMLQTIMPWFNLGNAAVSVGLSKAAVDAAVRHTSASRLEHLAESLSALPTIRAQLARMSIELACTQASSSFCSCPRSAAPPDGRDVLGFQNEYLPATSPRRDDGRGIAARVRRTTRRRPRIRAVAGADGRR